jgi:FkbM family methyltransferase
MSERFATVLTFEPAEECLPTLEANAEMLRNVTVHPIALSDFDGFIDLVDIPDKIDTGQLVSFEAEGMEYDAHQQGHKLRQVRAVRLDSYLDTIGYGNAPDFLKIDVEGHELKVLEGATETLKRYRPDMLIEIHSKALGEKILTLLEELDYNIEVVRHPHYTYSRGLEHMWEVHYWLRCFSTY